MQKLDPAMPTMRFTFSLPKQLMDRFEATARKQRLSTAELLRMLITSEVNRA